MPSAINTDNSFEMQPASPSQKSSLSERLIEPTKMGHRKDVVEATPETTSNTPITADIPVVKGPKGLCYDVGKVADESRRKKLLANRASAKSSRQRRLNEARAARDDLARLEDENNALREANIVLQRRIAEAQADIKRFHSFAGNVIATCGTVDTVTSCSGELSMQPSRPPPFWTPFSRASPELALNSILSLSSPHNFLSRYGN